MMSSLSGSTFCGKSAPLFHSFCQQTGADSTAVHRSTRGTRWCCCVCGRGAARPPVSAWRTGNGLVDVTVNCGDPTKKILPQRDPSPVAAAAVGDTRAMGWRPARHRDWPGVDSGWCVGGVSVLARGFLYTGEGRARGSAGPAAATAAAVAVAVKPAAAYSAWVARCSANAENPLARSCG